MAIFQVATNTPSKGELIAGWIGDQSWASTSDGPVELLGSFHIDDPDGRVGMQVHIVQSGDDRFQVPLTYRDERLDQLEDAYLGPMEHSVLGTRHVYDGLGDNQFITVLAGISACGGGQALGFAKVDGRWQAWPDAVRLHAFGSLAGRVMVDGFERVPTDSTDVVLRNDDLELTVFRTLVERPDPELGIAATWPSQPNPIALVAVARRV